MKTRTKLYRNIGVHTKPLKWSKHSQQRKLWVFLQYIARELHYSHEREFCVPVVHISHLEVIFLFCFHSERALDIKKKIKPIYECICTSNLPDLMYAQIIKYCLVYFCVAFSRFLRIMTQNESCDIRQLYVVELAVVMIPSKTVVISDQYWAPVLGPSCHRTSLT